MTPEPRSAQPPQAAGAGPAWRDGSWGQRLRQWLWYGLVASGTATLSLTLLQLLLGQRLQQAQTDQIGAEVALTLGLGELALERYGPRDLSEISGLRLAVAPRPGGRPATQPSLTEPAEAALLRVQAERLRQNLCQRLQPARCPSVLPASSPPRGAWVEMASPLESVWLFVPMPLWRGWPPDPWLLMLALAAGGLMAGLLYLTLEVQRPLRLLEEALAGVGIEPRPGPLPARGAGAVRQLTTRFNAMVERLELASLERRTMLAGMAHDLRSPLTRLRLRLGIAADSSAAAERAQAEAEADLNALERITSQFLQFAGADQAEPAVSVPLDALLAEASSVAAAVAVQLELQPLQRRVRPTALTRAVANLVENAVVHGQPPFRLVLQAVGSEDFEIQMWDGGAGIAPEQWPLALQPFQRLNQARGGQGHCGLGLAIAERVARDHDGSLSCAGAAGCFAVLLRGRSQPSS